MEYLLMTDDVMDPSFLDEDTPGVCWAAQWTPEREQKAGKRKQPEGDEGQTLAPGSQDKSGQPAKIHRREHGE
jgi:hypothetical protein